MNSPIDPAQAEIKRYRVTLEITIDQTGYEDLHNWDWHSLLGLEIEEEVTISSISLVKSLTRQEFFGY